MKKTVLLGALASIVALYAVPADAQQKKVLAIVVKGLDNPFFEQINLGCQKWQKENPNSEYTCLYTGPASSADEAGRGADRRRSADQGRRRDRDLAVERAGHGQPAQAPQPDHPGDDDRRRSLRRRPRACARRTSAPTTT